MLARYMKDISDESAQWYVCERGWRREHAKAKTGDLKSTDDGSVAAVSEGQTEIAARGGAQVGAWSVFATICLSMCITDGRTYHDVLRLVQIDDAEERSRAGRLCHDPAAGRTRPCASRSSRAAVKHVAHSG